MIKKDINFNDKFLVAGAGGMVGSAICRALKKRIRNEKIHGGKIFSPSKNELNYFDYEATYKWFQLNKPTVVIIAAAKVGGILTNSNFPTEFILDNLKIQNNLISIAYKFGVKKLLFLGSSCIYQNYLPSLLKRNTYCLEHWKPLMSYMHNLKLGIKLCEALNKQYKFNTIYAHNLYGPGDNYHSTGQSCITFIN